jgi:hypothetical protein
MQNTKTIKELEAADELIGDITAKLIAYKPILARSLDFGRLTWQRDKNGVVRVKIQPEL